MAYEFKFPDIGEGLTEGEIVRWLVKEGDEVKEGQPLVEVETDKALAEIPSPKTGVVLKILAKGKEIVKVGQAIVVFGEKGEAAAEKEAPAAPPAKPKPAGGKGELKEAPEEPVGPEAKPAAAEKEAHAAVPAKPTSVGVVGELEEAPEEPAVPEKRPAIEKPAFVSPHVLAAPAVRALARELGVAIEKVRGTGAEGRVVEKDVRQASEAREKPAEPVQPPSKVKKYDFYGFVERVPLRGVRRSIAKAMVKSKYTAPHVTAMDEADVTELWKIKEKEKTTAEKKKIKLTILPFIIKAVVAGLKEHPYLNASLDDESEEIVLKKYFNIGVATDTPDGLMVPVVKDAGDKSILHLAEELLQLSDKARNRKIDLADLKGGTFTITNYGAVGGMYGTPIINHPEVAILGVGRMKEVPVVRDGKVDIRKILFLSLSFDHRVVDGAEAARFLNTIISRLEDPDLIFLES
jgi:pyruvate dehydrogenase E2 component (dihydrolipoamide acetyltransferase)